MLRNIILSYAPLVLLALWLLFATVKFLYLRTKGLWQKNPELLWTSMLPYSKQEIKNAYHREVKHYYKFSNRVNKRFYIIIVFLIGLYLLFSIIGDKMQQ